MRKVSLAFGFVASAGLLAGGGCSLWHSSPSGSSNNSTAATAKTNAPPYNGQLNVVSDDPTSVYSKSPKLGPDFYVASAQAYIAANNLDDAVGQYKKALQLDQNNLPALLGFAHLQDQRQNYDEADKLYQRALQSHPGDAAMTATVMNDWGLSYQRRGNLDRAAMILSKAVAAQPNKKLYRNNLASVLVAMNRPDEAYRQMAPAEGPAVAHYNVATLLYKKGATQQAADQFALAAQADPSLVQARQWVQRLAGGAPGPAAGPVMVAAAPPAPPASYAAQGMPPAPVADQRAAVQNQQPVLVAARLRGVVPSEDDPPADGPDAGRIPPCPPAPPANFGGGGPVGPSVSAAIGPAASPTVLHADSYAVRYPLPSAPPSAVDRGMPPSPEQLPNLPAGNSGLVPLPPVE